MATTSTAVAARSRPRTPASASIAARSLAPSTSTTVRTSGGAEPERRQRRDGHRRGGRLAVVLTEVGVHLPEVADARPGVHAGVGVEQLLPRAGAGETQPVGVVRDRR